MCRGLRANSKEAKEVVDDAVKIRIMMAVFKTTMGPMSIVARAEGVATVSTKPGMATTMTNGRKLVVLNAGLRIRPMRGLSKGCRHKAASMPAWHSLPCLHHLHPWLGLLAGEQMVDLKLANAMLQPLGMAEDSSQAREGR